MVHVFWKGFCLLLPFVLAAYGTLSFDLSGQSAVIVFSLLALLSALLSYFLYKGGLLLGAPIANYYFKNPLAHRKRLLDGVVFRGFVSFTLTGLLAFFIIRVALPKFDISTAAQSSIVIGLIGWALVHWLFKSQSGVLHLVNKATTPFREDHRAATRGDGGSGRLAGFWKEWDFPWIPGCLILGKSLYKDLWCGYKDIERNRPDDRHLLTVAGSRSGKGITRIIPNLLLCQDNVICIDPKGENATVTAHNPIRSQAFVIDPYGLVPNVSKTTNGTSISEVRPIRAKYNPLQDIDPYSLTAQEDITVLLEAMVFAQSDKNKEWERNAKAIIGGTIGHVLTAPEYHHDRSLVTVYRLLNGTERELQTLLAQMLQNRRMGDFIPMKAATLDMAIREDRQSFISTVRSSLEWISYPAVQELIGGDSDFSMFDIAHKPMSIYLCFSMEHLKTLNRFVRIFFLMAFHAMMHPRKPKTKKVLLLMDEFYVLGHLPILEEGAQYIAGDGVKIWIIIQNIEMIEKLYGKAWKNFTDSTGLIEAFALSADEDQGTAKWASNKLGKARSRDLGLGETAKSVETHNVLTPKEVEDEFSRQKRRALFFLTGHEPFALQIKPYWDLFHPSMYRESAQGVPLNAAQRKFMEATGWTHSRYFGFTDAILSTMGQTFDEGQRIREVTNYMRQGAYRPSHTTASPDVLPLVSLPGSVSSSSKRIPGPSPKILPSPAAVKAPAPQERPETPSPEEREIRAKEQEILHSLNTQKAVVEQRVKEEAEKQIHKIRNRRTPPGPGVEER